MRTLSLFAPFFALLVITLSVTATPPPIVKPKCNPRERGRDLEAKQRAAIKDFAHIFLVEKDAKKAFDAYIPG